MFKLIFIFLGVNVSLLFLGGCSEKFYSKNNTLDTVRMYRDPSFNFKCNKQSFYAPDLKGLPINTQRKIAANNHYENLECTDDLKHYRMASSNFVVDFKVPKKGKKEGKILLTFINNDSSLIDLPIEDRVIAIAVMLDKETVKSVFHLIDSLHMDSIYNVQNIFLGYVPGRHYEFANAASVYEFSTPDKYYFQSSPECSRKNLPCMNWINKLTEFEWKLVVLLQPYIKSINQMEKALAKKDILRI